MAKRASVLRRFEISDMYGGGIEVTHRFGHCDWRESLTGARVTDLMKQVTAHARTCDGKPQPRPERPAGHFDPYLHQMWGNTIKSALQARPVVAGYIGPL